MPTRTVRTQTTASPDVAHREKRKSRSCNCALMPQPAKKTRFTHPGDTSSPSSSVPNDRAPQTAADETTPWWMKRTEQEEEEFRRECEETAIQSQDCRGDEGYSTAKPQSATMFEGVR